MILGPQVQKAFRESPITLQHFDLKKTFFNFSKSQPFSKNRSTGTKIVKKLIILAFFPTLVFSRAQVRHRHVRRRRRHHQRRQRHHQRCCRRRHLDTEINFLSQPPASRKGTFFSQVLKITPCLKKRHLVASFSCVGDAEKNVFDAKC